MCAYLPTACLWSFLLNAGNACTVWSSNSISGTLSQKDKQILFFFFKVISVNIDVVL